MSAGGGWLLALALTLPIVLLLACLSSRSRPLLRHWLAVAPVPALAAALLAPGGTLDLPPALLGIRLALDTPSALLLGAAAVLWIGGGAYASAWLRDRPDPGRFLAWWLLTLIGSIGVFMAADLVGFYLMFSLVSLAAWGLVVDAGTERARRVGSIYVSLAVLGEAFLLLAFVMLAQGTPGDSLLIRDAVAALPSSGWRSPALALLVLGFGVKIGMVPFHVWMPLTYRTAPIPAAAVMSGAAVKAGVIGLLRFLPPDVAPPGWGTALVILGMVSALYGVLVGITRTHPKTVLAYSSISQMGVILAVLGMGLSRGDGGAVLPVAFYAAHHTLVKGALFLAVGVAQSSRTRRIWIVLAPAAVLAIGMSGLPPTGGALAKLAVKPVLGDGVVGLLGSLSSAGTALLMIHFLLRLAAIPGSDAGRSGLRLPWLGMAFASVAIPWALYLTVMDGTIAYALSPAVVWPALWPVMLGGAAAFGLRRLRLPDGDFVMLAAKDAARRAGAVGAMMERLDGLLRQWPVAALLVPTVAIVLFALMVLAGP